MYFINWGSVFLKLSTSSIARNISNSISFGRVSILIIINTFVFWSTEEIGAKNSVEISSSFIIDLCVFITSTWPVKQALRIPMESEEAKIWFKNRHASMVLQKDLLDRELITYYEGENLIQSSRNQVFNFKQLINITILKSPHWKLLFKLIQRF